MLVLTTPNHFQSLLRGMNIAPIEQVVKLIQLVHNPLAAGETFTFSASKEQRPAYRLVERVAGFEERDVLEDLVSQTSETDEGKSAFGIDEWVRVW